MQYNKKWKIGFFITGVLTVGAIILFATQPNLFQGALVANIRPMEVSTCIHSKGDVVYTSIGSHSRPIIYQSFDEFMSAIQESNIAEDCKYRIEGGSTNDDYFVATCRSEHLEMNSWINSSGIEIPIVVCKKAVATNSYRVNLFENRAVVDLGMDTVYEQERDVDDFGLSQFTSYQSYVIYIN